MSQPPNDKTTPTGYFTIVLSIQPANNTHLLSNQSNPSTPGSQHSNSSQPFSPLWNANVPLSPKHAYQSQLAYHQNQQYGFQGYTNPRNTQPHFFPQQSSQPSFFSQQSSQPQCFPQHSSQPQFKIPQAQEPREPKRKQKRTVKQPVVELDEGDENEDMETRRLNIRWNDKEEILLAEAWIEHSQDNNIGKDQRDEIYWNKIIEDFHDRTTGPYPKWDAAEPIDGDNLQEVFGPDKRERPAGKQRAGKKQKSVETSGSTGGSQSESVSSLVSQDYRRKCDAAERAYEAQREKIIASKNCEEMKFLMIDTINLNMPPHKRAVSLKGNILKIRRKFKSWCRRKLHANAEADTDELVDPPKIEDKLGAVPHGLSTDSDVAKREAESMTRKNLRSNAEKFEFQAEVSRLMDILINSLYSNKDIFLRELISNASDIKLDKQNKILSIRDRGVGMTKEDLIKNLGTIANSWNFRLYIGVVILNLIGQFGVGFYSVYLVADYVEVISKHNDDKQYVWESKADGAFAISEDTYNEPLGRGTEIRLHLREEAGEYLEESKLKELVKKYSEFINFPIYLWASKEVRCREKAEATEGEEKEEEDSDKEEDEEKSKTKTIKETSYEWERLNDVKAIWLRNPKEVTEEEYTKFYHSLAKDFGDEKPMAWSHFTAEGDVEFKAVLFVPPKAPTDLYESYYNANKSNLKLYVRRVFISDEFDELLPKYLSFLLGLVDSDTLPLNVSREMLQQHNSLKTIKKKLIRKALDMIRKLAEEDPDEVHDKENKEVEESKDNDEKRGQYTKFWNEFGKSVKLGIIEDAANRNRLAKLLRFETTKSDGKLTSLDQYISRMKSGQKDIFYITGSSKEQLERSPFLERLKKKNFEEGLKLGKDSKDKETKESFKELTKWWKETLATENVDDVKISSRLADTPCVVVTSKYGWSANMERIMQSQTLSDASKQAYMRGKRVLEINARHPIIKELRERVVKDPEDASVKTTAQLMYQTALMESGFMLSDPKDFASRIYDSVKTSLSISPDATVDEEEEVEEAPEAESSPKEETESTPTEEEETDVKDEL
ncbi:endoplasmin [Tanacetum coccineum]